MSVNTQSNFQLVNFFIADYPPIGVNQVLYVKYTEDMRQATTTMEVQITDSETGFLSDLQGMEPVFIRIADSKGETEVGGELISECQPPSTLPAIHSPSTSISSTSLSSLHGGSPSVPEGIN